MVTPSDVWRDYQGVPSGQCFWIDAVEMESGMAGSSNVTVMGAISLENGLGTWKKRPGKTLRGLYVRAQLTCLLEVGGLYRWFQQEHSSGQKAVCCATSCVERLSASCQVPILSLEERRRPRELWPTQVGGSEVSVVGQIVVCGGAREWIQGSGTPSGRSRLAAADALWRPTPVELWAGVISNISSVDCMGGARRET